MNALGIANQALELAGLGRIGALNEPSSNAKLVSGAYPLVAQTILRGDAWPSLVRYDELVEDTTTPNATAFARLYTLPANVLRVLSVNERTSGYQVVDTVLACDDEEVRLGYFLDATTLDPMPIPGDLGLAIIYELAAQLAEAKDPKRAPILRAEAQRAFFVARMSAGLDRPEEAETPTSWVDA